MADVHPSEDFPTITRETFKSAQTFLLSQYSDGHSEAYPVSPRAVYLDQLPSYDEFFTQFLMRNQLCILSEQATRDWHSRQHWVSCDGSPNFGYLQQEFGEVTVPVADCKQKEFSAHAKREMGMAEFLSYWQRYREAGHPTSEECLYLKDWHFTRAFPNYKAYSTCGFFRSDWMNEFWDGGGDDDYRFVYMGPQGTWTPFHADVFCSFSWSANICGTKRWIFYPPGEEEHLYDSHHTLAYDVTSDLHDPITFPSAHMARHRIEVLQRAGETIFVPSGWHHQVQNLEDTISINHNWLNGCNVRHCWQHLRSALAEVRQEISDCSDMEGWEEQCQTVLRAFTGLDLHQFFSFMQSVAQRRIRALEAQKKKGKDSSTLSDCANLSLAKAPHGGSAADTAWCQESVRGSGGQYFSCRAQCRDRMGEQEPPGLSKPVQRDKPEDCTLDSCHLNQDLTPNADRDTYRGTPCSYAGRSVDMFQDNLCNLLENLDFSETKGVDKVNLSVKQSEPSIFRSASHGRNHPGAVNPSISYDCNCSRKHVVEKDHNKTSRSRTPGHSTTDQEKLTKEQNEEGGKTTSSKDILLLEGDTGERGCQLSSDSFFNNESKPDPERLSCSSWHQTESSPLGDMLDLDFCKDSQLTDSAQRPHWSRCNSYHALFDLCSVAMVIRDMKRSGSLDRCQDSDGDTVPQVGARAVTSDSKQESQLDVLLREIYQTLSDFGENIDWFC